ncbi:Fur family transcriptional regulator [Aeromicrobium sp.]|uniref:Fur family transcriptional regulator n=1 Tax=Aeromicrobium sp. TaxID=1871063 RepID=UPI0030C474D0
MESSRTGSHGAAEAVAALRAKGERVTSPRRAVIEVLGGTMEHLTADEIAVRASQTAPGVHRTTVYRALTTLGELGLVSHTHVSGSATIYHLAAPGHDHPGADHAHVQCTTCNRIIDIKESALAPLGRTLLEDIGFRIDVHHAAFVGTCSECLESTRN